MSNFFEKNKTFIAIIIGALIIGGFIYFSKTTPTPPTTPPTTGGIVPPITNEGQEKELEKPTSSVSQCIDFRKAGNYIGDYKCVRGRVDNVYTSKKGNTFLNFCPDYKTCSFSSVIFSSDSYKFSNPKRYQGKTVEITGLIKTYQGRAEIILNDPSQIKIK